MERKFKITVDGRQYSVTVEELGDGGGIADQNLTFVPIASHTPRLANSHSTPAPAPAVARTAARTPAEPGDIVSPLGGVVDSVLVAVGQQVSSGDRVAVVEAMKMKTPVISEQAGQVASILVQAGDGVETGQVMLKLN
jgi:biotin carboxyl carrier protein